MNTFGRFRPFAEQDAKIERPSFAKRFFRATAYPAFFVISFVFFCYQTFPYDRLRDYIVDKVSTTGARGPGQDQGYELEILELEPYWFSGVELSGVAIRKRPATPAERTQAMTFPRIVARVSILPLLLGRARVGLEAETPTGTIDADVTAGFDGVVRTVDAEFVDVNLRHLSLAGLAGKVPLKGVFSGTIDLDMTSGKANGRMDLTIRALELGDGQTRVPIPGTLLAGGLTLEIIRVGTLQLTTQFTDGVGRVERLSSRGADLELRGIGDIRIDRDPRLARLDLFLQAKFTDAFRNKSDRTRSMFQLMEMNGRIRQAKASDGSWQFRLRGSPSGQMIPTPAGSERFPAR